MKYGRLTLLEPMRRTRDKHKCICDCGNILFVRLNSLKSGNTKSCGCLKKELTSQCFSKHGKKFTPEYTSWQLMKDRCLNKNNKTYKYYGGRGIKVCSEWIDSFERFFLDMGEKPSKHHTLDRINTNGDYSRENCRWASKKEQVRNRHNTKMIKYKNETRPLAEWCEILGLDYANTNKRLFRKWTIERAFTEPKRR
ncbi:hypothetical protein [Pasteurella multocida]|uniref:hypothetical protein n=1 Tax=Pasteurella multocida TaxID=747 RepID=UPI00099966C5|nr:hypothetical protein [Pasteurella multocida]MBE7395157.1 hypothetical protein [Pasteurella multocida]MCL7756130.1 hypothetical protein [Pasteurella multocida]MCL7779860.1 hypothetical protein [Pasteurella multocida]OPC90922.1 hypothetical protein BTV60_06305 [Pasteurella multocida subsp. septica]OPD04943.1 hypothetical protein BTV52_07245 [Pasteurella multocida subsp. septica]